MLTTERTWVLSAAWTSVLLAGVVAGLLFGPIRGRSRFAGLCGCSGFPAFFPLKRRGAWFLAAGRSGRRSALAAFSCAILHRLILESAIRVFGAAHLYRFHPRAPFFAAGAGAAPEQDRRQSN